MSNPMEPKTSSSTVVLGERSAAQLTFALMRGYCISNDAKDMLLQKNFISPADKGEVIRLALRRVRDIGYPRGTDYQHLCAGAIMKKLDLCPAEVAPILRLRWKFQPANGKKVRIAMKPVHTSKGGDGIFYLTHTREQGLCLDVEDIYPDDFYEPDDFFVFADTRKLLALPKSK